MFLPFFLFYTVAEFTWRKITEILSVTDDFAQMSELMLHLQQQQQQHFFYHPRKSPIIACSFRSDSTLISVPLVLC